MAGKPKPKPVYKQEGSGRPSKFTPERCAEIIDDIAHHVPYQLAAEANGICEDTLYEWLKIGRQHAIEGIQSDYAVFSEGIKRAEKNKIRSHTENIASHVNQWQSDAWLLERRWYKYFGTNAHLHDLNSRLTKLLEEQGNGESN